MLLHEVLYSLVEVVENDIGYHYSEDGEDTDAHVLCIDELAGVDAYYRIAQIEDVFFTYSICVFSSA